MKSVCEDSAQGYHDYRPVMVPSPYNSYNVFAVCRWCAQSIKVA